MVLRRAPIMMSQFSPAQEDRIILSRGQRSSVVAPSAQRRSYLWTIIGGVLGSTILFWVMVQLGQASSISKGKATANTQTSVPPVAAEPAVASEVPMAEPDETEKPLSLPSTAVQGPAIDTPREVI